MTIHIQTEYLDRDIARDVAAELGCLIGFSSSSIYPDHTQVTITGEDAGHWQGDYFRLLARRFDGKPIEP